MANETIFGTKTKEYVPGRSSYAPAAVDRIAENVLRKGNLIEDVGYSGSHCYYYLMRKLYKRKNQ